MIQNIWAVGRNYAEHAKEMGQAPTLKPMFFLKSGSCISEGDSFSLPAWAKEIHHEIELAFQVDQNLQISAWALALDLTERQLQSDAKKAGQPWTLAKSFKGACPLSPLITDLEWSNLKSLEIELKINGQIRQSGGLDQMIFKPADLLAFVKEHFPLTPGDLILTGTPAGVGPLKSGDLLEARVGNLLSHQWRVNF